jgi:hypothetical protein
VAPATVVVTVMAVVLPKVRMVMVMMRLMVMMPVLLVLVVEVNGLVMVVLDRIDKLCFISLLCHDFASSLNRVDNCVDKRGDKRGDHLINNRHDRVDSWQDCRLGNPISCIYGL